MKKVLVPSLLLFVIVFFVGCTYVFSIINAPELNVEKVATTGDIFFNHEEGWRLEGGNQSYRRPNKAFKFDLTILELTDQKMVLQYYEYWMPYRTPQWFVKEGFTKRFDFAIADKIIRFRDYEFEVISVEKGQIKYKRVK